MYDYGYLFMVWCQRHPIGLGLGLWFSHVVELWLWCLQGHSLSLGWCYKFYCPRMYGYCDTLL